MDGRVVVWNNEYVNVLGGERKVRDVIRLVLFRELVVILFIVLCCVVEYSWLGD